MCMLEVLLMVWKHIARSLPATSDKIGNSADQVKDVRENMLVPTKGGKTTTLNIAGLAEVSLISWAPCNCFNSFVICFASPAKGPVRWWPSTFWRRRRHASSSFKSWSLKSLFMHGHHTRAEGRGRAGRERGEREREREREREGRKERQRREGRMKRERERERREREGRKGKKGREEERGEKRGGGNRGERGGGRVERRRKKRGEDGTRKNVGEKRRVEKREEEGRREQNEKRTKKKNVWCVCKEKYGTNYFASSDPHQ